MGSLTLAPPSGVPASSSDAQRPAKPPSAAGKDKLSRKPEDKPSVASIFGKHTKQSKVTANFVSSPMRTRSSPSTDPCRNGVSDTDRAPVIETCNGFWTYKPDNHNGLDELERHFLDLSINPQSERQRIARRVSVIDLT